MKQERKIKDRRRASVVCVHEGELLTILLCDPETAITRHYVPGGMIDPGETPAEAAIRETLEETGYWVSLETSSETMLNYPFNWDHCLYMCVTHFFLATLRDPKQTPQMVDDAHYHRGVEWLPLEKIH